MLDASFSRQGEITYTSCVSVVTMATGGVPCDTKPAVALLLRLIQYSQRSSSCPSLFWQKTLPVGRWCRCWDAPRLRKWGLDVILARLAINGDKLIIAAVTLVEASG